MSMEVKSLYYNYYNVKGRYSPKTPETPSWRKQYETVDDHVKANNGNTESGLYKALCKLEEEYYNSAVANRSRYKDVDSLKQALADKYLFGDAYSGYDDTQRRAMYDNELSMTMFGTCGNMNDPRLNGPVRAATDSEQSSYNRQMVNLQINNIFSNAGLNVGLLGNMKFSIDPFHYSLTVSGIDDKTAGIVEQLLNADNNSVELFHHIMQSNRSRIDEPVMDKYRAVRNFRDVTGEDLRTYSQTQDGFVDKNGRNALAVYEKALETTNRVPSQFKGTALEVFSGNLQVLMGKEFASIPDMNLQIGFSNGELQDSVFNPKIMGRLDLQV